MSTQGPVGPGLAPLDNPPRSQAGRHAIWVAAACLLLAAMVGSVMYVRDLRREQTDAAWQDALRISARMEATGNWTTFRAWNPCGDANPEAFIDMHAVAPSLQTVREVEADLRSQGWIITIPLTEASLADEYRPGLAAAAPNRQVALTLEEVDPVPSVVISVDEAC